MNSNREEQLHKMGDGAKRVKKGIKRGRQFEIEVDGQPLEAFDGETIASALLASGRRILRYTPKSREPRSLFCGIGVCFECVMTVDGVPNVRTCTTPAKPGMKIKTQHDL